MSTDRDFAHTEHDRRIANLILIGTIAALDLSAGRASVQIDATWTTDLLPWIEPRAGATLRTWSAPDVGEQVVVLSPSGEPGAGVILRGVNSTANPSPAQAANLFVLGQWSDGALDQYDVTGHVRTITLPAGGQLVVNVGAQTSATVADGSITLKQGSAQLVLDGGAVTVTGASSIAFGSGGKAVARVGDTVANGVITSGSSLVKAA